MFHGTLALLNQALRADSRKLSAHLFLLFFAGFIFLVTLVVSVIGTGLGAPGLTLFRSIAWTNFLFILLAGLSFFCLVLSDEKEEGALDLLKLVGVTPVILLLGKSTSQLMFALLLLAVQLPFTQLAITLGGVSLSQILAAYIALGSFTVLIANFSLFCAALSEKESSVPTRVLVSYVLYNIGISLIFHSLSGLASSGQSVTFFDTTIWPVIQFLHSESITMKLSEILSTGYAGTLITPQVYLHLCGGMFFFVCSCLMFEKRVLSAAKNKTGSQRDVYLNTTKFRSNRQIGRPWKKAIAWKEFHFHCGGYQRVTQLFVIYWVIFALLFIIVSLSDHIPTRAEVSGYLIGGGLLFCVIELFLNAHNLFSAEVRNQTWADLLMVSGSIPRIAREKIYGCLFQSMASIFYLMMGVVLAPDLIIGIVIDEPLVLLIPPLIMLWLAICLPLITLASLEVTRGSLAVSLFLILLSFTCVGWFILFLAIFSIPLIGRKLRALAAE